MPIAPSISIRASLLQLLLSARSLGAWPYTYMAQPSAKDVGRETSVSYTALPSPVSCSKNFSHLVIPNSCSLSLQLRELSALYLGSTSLKLWLRYFPQAKGWVKHELHLTCIYSLKGQNSMLPRAQCLKTCISYILPSFKVITEEIIVSWPKSEDPLVHYDIQFQGSSLGYMLSFG